MNKKNLFKLIALSYFTLGLIEFPIKLFNFKYLLALGLIILNAIYIRLFLLAYKNKKIKDLASRMIFLLNYINSSFLLFFLFPNISFGIKAVIIAIFTMFLYVLILSINIYLVSDLHKDTLPLLQPSRLIVYIANVLNIFLTLSFIYKLPLFYDAPVYNLLFKIGLIIGYFSTYFYFLDWYIKSEAGDISKRENQNIRELKLFAASTLSILSVTLMFIPFESFGRALIVGACIYCLLGFIQGVLSHRLHFGFVISAIIVMFGTYILVTFL